MTDRNKWQLNDEEKNRFEKGVEKQLNDAEKLSIYNGFVEKQKENFLAIVENVNTVINKLKEKRIISDYVKFRARIKAPESAIKNDEKKSLDDIFGVEIITSTEREIELIKKQLERYVNILKGKKYNKSNGYRAEHFSYVVKPEILKRVQIDKSAYDYIPIIEFQMKTIAVYVECNGGSADHTEYKNETKEQIQKKYNEGRI